MLITLSGMVGSGKSTAARALDEICRTAGLECRCVRFRSIGLLGNEKPIKPAADVLMTARSREKRWRGFQPRRLTARVALGYAVRMLGFRLFGPKRNGPDWIVLDRYFYDSFVHYGLATRSEQFYLSVLRRLIPVPDIAVLLQASPEVVAARRPEYAAEYLTRAGSAYDTLTDRFPELVTVRTDQGDAMWQQMDSLIRERTRTAARRQPAPRQETQ